MTRETTPDFSLVAPVYNEIELVEAFVREVIRFLDSHNGTGQLVCVDDGSTDGTFQVLRRLAEEDARVGVVRLRRNFGQTAAISAGIEHCTGRIIIPIDADLQNDPEDVGRLLREIEKGADVASGWRRHRHDKFLTRRLPSMLANQLISIVTGVHLHDYGCTLKAYRREVLEPVMLYGEMHRFIPAYAAWQGAHITEIEVNHRPRTAGKSKYGLGRTFKVILDLLTVKFLSGYSTKPLYVFGAASAVLISGGLLSGAVLVYQKLFQGAYMIQSPLLHLSALLISLSFQTLLIGLLAEVQVRTYYESADKKPFTIAETVNL